LSTRVDIRIDTRGKPCVVTRRNVRDGLDESVLLYPGHSHIMYVEGDVNITLKEQEDGNV
jgi:hypothetical protein